VAGNSRGDAFSDCRRAGRSILIEALKRLARRVDAGTGGTARLRVIVLFAAVEALASADQGTVGAIAPQLERALRISNGQIGIVAAVAALAGAVGTIPAGALTDRIHRINLLAASILLWSASMVGSALAPSFLVLILTRIAMGAVTATSGPTVASLTGDFFPAAERAKIWGLILTGELIGAGVGVEVSGNLATALSWRYGFVWLAIPGLALTTAIWKLLVEPARGGQSRLEPGTEKLVSAEEVEQREVGRPREASAREMLQEEQELAQEIAREQHKRPHPELVLHDDPVKMPLFEAIRYVLRVRTNLVLIVASALGYLFYAGVQTFTVLLLRTRYGLAESAATSLLLLIGVGALAGVVLGGRIADRLLRGGHISARVLVGAISYIAAAVIFVPGLLSPVLLISIPLFVAGGACLGARDPSLNAARLDIMHPRLWGRAEGVRTVLQQLALAGGPLLFGFLSGALGGPASSVTASGHIKHTSALAYTFLIMLVPVAVSGLILLRAKRTYPRDVATASASIEAVAEQEASARPASETPLSAGSKSPRPGHRRLS
jgi:predicted MFS family arabinose efflux permease